MYISRILCQEGSPPSSQEVFLALEIEMERLKMERDESRTMKDAAKNHSAEAAISSGKTKSALAKLPKQFKPANAEI